MRFSLLLLNCFVLTLVAATPSSGGFVNRDGFATDTISNLDWLDLSATSNSLYGEVESRFATDLAGWRFATEAEFDGLVMNVLGHAPVSGYSTQNADLTIITEAIGVTRGTPTSGTVDGFLYSQPGWPGVLVQSFVTAEYPSGSIEAALLPLFGPSRADFRANAFLVRPASPFGGTTVQPGDPDPINFGGFDESSSSPGAAQVSLPTVSTESTLSVEYELLAAESILLPGNFTVPGSQLQSWSVNFDSELSGNATLKFVYDESLLAPGTNEDALFIHHTFSDGSGTQILRPNVDSLNNILTVEVDRFSSFAIVSSAVPEPSSLAVFGIGACVVGFGVNRR